MFTEQDLRQIAEHGLSAQQVELQLENFRRGFPHLNVVRAASPGDGVTVGAYASVAVAPGDVVAVGDGVAGAAASSGAGEYMAR